MAQRQAAATITTVGYGDVYPKTPAGRGAAVALMLVGISMFGLLTARVAAVFVESDEEEQGSKDPRIAEILRRLERIERSLAREPGASVHDDDAGHPA